MLLGRDPERDHIGRLLEDARAARGAALVLRGPAGAGKTALMADTEDRADDMRVLRARGIESESELPFAGLHALLRPAAGLIDGLPGPQAAALRAALGLAERGAEDRFLVSAGCLGVLAEMAESRPLLCLVDDAHWLDAPSADALLFAARRLGDDAIAMVFSAREGDVRTFDAPGVPALEVGALDAGAAGAIVDAGGRPVAPEVRDAIVAGSAGNALALVEVPGALSDAQLAGREPLPDVLPVPRDLEGLFLSRVERLPEDTRRMMTLVAADDTGGLDVVLRAAAAHGIGDGALTAAEEAGLVDVRGVQVDVRHPLVRSAILQGASTGTRRWAHLALADAVGDASPDHRAWHRAAAALGPDDEVAADLERAAERAALRGGHGAASAAYARAADLGTDPGARGRRLVEAAGAAWHAGRPDTAGSLLDRARPDVRDAAVGARARHLRGVVGFWCGPLPAACETLMGAAEDAAATDPRAALEMLFDAGEAAGWAGDFARMTEVGHRAVTLQRLDAEEDVWLAKLLNGVGDLWAGRSHEGTMAVREAIAGADAITEPRWLTWAAAGAGSAGADEREEAMIRRAIALARESGAVDALTLILSTAAVRGLFEGRFELAAEAEEGYALAHEAGLRNAAALHLSVLAHLDGLAGEEDRCRARAAEVAEAARANGMVFADGIAEWGVAMLEYGTGRVEPALARLQRLSVPEPGRVHDHIGFVSAPDLVEAAVRAGRPGDAQAGLERLTAFARPGAPDWALALAARCRGIVAQDDDEAVAELTTAVELHTRPFDRARSLLLLGERLRRTRRRADAREHLRAALEAFEAQGAVPWAERARGELRATGETARRSADADAGLTAQERQIARMVAQGLTNKEVAAQLYLSPRTIDAHMRGVFSKLGITSRRELRGLSLGDEAGPLPA